MSGTSWVPITLFSRTPAPSLAGVLRTIRVTGRLFVVGVADDMAVS